MGKTIIMIVTLILLFCFMRYRRMLAFLLLRLYQNSENKTKAVKWLKVAAYLGNDDAQFVLGYLYDEGDEGLSVDKDKAFKWLKKAAYKGNTGAFVKLTNKTIKGEVSSSIHDGVVSFRKEK